MRKNSTNWWLTPILLRGSSPPLLFRVSRILSSAISGGVGAMPTSKVLVAFHGFKCREPIQVSS